ncbi:hypothetical protein ABK040_011377 [Willaertia magna]
MGIITELIGLFALNNWGNIFRTFGGSAFSFHSTKTLVYGKYFRVIEYPFGDMRTIRINLNSYSALKNKIAEANGIDPKSIQQISRYEENFWTEKVSTNDDVRSLREFHILLWSRSVGHIPTKNVNLKEIPEEVMEKEEKESVTTTTSSETGTTTSTPLLSHDKVVSALSYIHHLKKRELFTDEEYQVLTDLILQQDPYILSLHSNFKDDEETFVIYAKRKVIDYTVGMHAISLPQNLRQKKNAGVLGDKDKDEEGADLNAVY